MKGKKIFKKIVVSALTLAIMCSNIPVSAGSLPEEEITIVTDDEAPEPEEPKDETPASDETAGSEQSEPSAPVTGDSSDNGAEEIPSVTEPSQDTGEDPAPEENLETKDPTPGTEPPAPGTEDPTPGTEDPAPGMEDPTPGTEDPAPGTEDPTPGTENPGMEEQTDPAEQPEEQEPDEEFTEEDPMDYENQTPIEEASRTPDEEGAVATIWKARAARSMLFSLYNFESQDDEEAEKKAWTFDAYYVNQQDPYNVTKTNNFDLKYQMEFHANQDLAKGAVLIRIEAPIYRDRQRNLVLPAEIAVPEGTLEKPSQNRTTPFNYFIEYEKDADGNDLLDQPKYLVFFNYKKIPSGSNAAWQVLYKNQKLMDIIDETPWTLTPMINVDTGAKVPTEEEPKPDPARPYDKKLFEGTEDDMEGTEERTPLTGRIDSSVNLTSVVKSAYSEPGRNYTPGLYTERQIERYINGAVPDKYKKDGKLDTASWRFAVWDVKIQGTATQPWSLRIQDIPTLGQEAETEGVQVVGFKDHSDPTTSYRLAITEPQPDRLTGTFSGEQTVLQNRTEESWGSRFYVVTAYPADRVTPGTVVRNAVKVTMDPFDPIDPDVTRTSTPAEWTYRDYNWSHEGDVLWIDKQNGIGSEDNTVYTGWLDAYRVSSEKGEDYGDIPFSTGSTFYGYSYTHRTRNGSEGGVSYTTGDYIPGTYYTHTTADDFLYLYTGKNSDEPHPLTENDYYFSDVTITQTDYGYDVWEDEKRTTDLSRVNSAELPAGIFTGTDGSLQSPVRIYAMLGKPDGTFGKADTQGWTLVDTRYIDAYPYQDVSQLTVRFSDIPGLLEQQPYRVKVEHDSIDYESTCRIDVKVCLRHIDKENRENQIMAAVLNAHDGIESNVDSPRIRLENISGNMCHVYYKKDAQTTSVERAFAGQKTTMDDGSANPNYQEPGLLENTRTLYPEQLTEKNGRLLNRENAIRDLTWLSEVAAANKESKTTNDVDHNRVLVDYYLTAYDGYEIYDRGCLDYLNEHDQNLISPGRTHVVFYDLLPYGMQYDASVTPTAGRITDLDSNGYYKTRPGNWSSTQVQVVVDPDRDITVDYRGTGRTMVAFHIIYTGAESAVYTAQKWIEGWGVSFRAYFDWKDISQINNIDINSNLCAFMPDFTDSSNFANPSLCGLKTEVDYDDGTHGDAAADRDEVEAAYADMVKSYIAEDDTEVKGNIDGISRIEIEGEDGTKVIKYIDQENRNVIYAKNTLSANVATSSSSKIETLVHADSDLLGPFGPIATVPVSENATPENKMNLYTYDNTVTVSSKTTDIVIFDRLERAAEDRTADKQDDPFKPFAENRWSGTFRGIDTNGLDKKGIKGYTVYYNMRSDAPVTTGTEDPATVLTGGNGWYTEKDFIQNLPEGSDKANWQRYVKAVAVDLGEAEIDANDSVSFRIQMTAPATPEEGQRYTYNNASFSSWSINNQTRSTVTGNSVRTAVGKPQTLEITKKTSGAVPSALQDERFEFRIYETYLYEGEETEQALAYARYRLYRWNRQTKEWEEQRDQAYATDGSGRLYLHADERAVFEVVDAGRLTVQETENVFWEQQILDRTTKSVDGRRIGAEDGDRRDYTVTNVYRPVLYAQKSIASVPEGVNLTEADRTFTFQIRTKGNDGEYHELANAEYWVVDSVRLDGGIPTKLGEGVTGQDGTFTIKTGEIIALFPGIAGTQYELSEVIPEEGSWNWHCEKPVLEGKLPSGGDSRTITNYYRWKDLLLKKEITHQTKEEYDAAGQAFTFRLFEAELGADGKPKTDSEGNPVPKKDADENYTTKGLKWVLLDENGQESAAAGESGELHDYGTFTCMVGYRTVKVKGLEAGKLYVLEELPDGIPEVDGRLLYVPDNDTVEVKMPIYSTGKDVTVTNDYQKRPLSVTKTVVGSNDSGEDREESGIRSAEPAAYALDRTEENNGSGESDIHDPDLTENTGAGDGSDTSAAAQSYHFRVTITRPGSTEPVSVAGVRYTVTKQGAEPKTETLTADGEFILSDGETVTFKDIGMLGDAFEVAELSPDNENQIYPPKGTNHTGTLAGDGCGVSFVNGASGSLLISKEYEGLDELGRELVKEWKDSASESDGISSQDSTVRFVLNVWADGAAWEAEVPVTKVNQLADEPVLEEEYIRTGEPFDVDPWTTISIPVGKGPDSIPDDAVYTLEEVEEDRILPYGRMETGADGTELTKTYWMQISQAEASKELKTEKSVAERPVAVIHNEVSTLPAFTGSEIRKYMTSASSTVPEGAKLVWRVEQYDNGRWTPAEGISYVVFALGEPVSDKPETTGTDGRIPLVMQEKGYPSVCFQQDQVYLNLYRAEDISDLLDELPEGKRLLRMVEVPEESDSEWGLLAGYVSTGSSQGGGSVLSLRKAPRMGNQSNLGSTTSAAPPYSMNADPREATGFMNSNVPTALEIEKQMTAVSEKEFTMILRQVLSTNGDVTPETYQTAITADRPAAGIPYTIYGTQKKGVTGPNGEIKLNAGERAVLNVPDGTMWTVSEQTSLTPNYRLAGLDPENGKGSDRLTKLNENLMLIDLPASVRYTLTFDPCGGTGGPGTLVQMFKEEPEDAVVFQIPDVVPHKDGYQFLGWAEEPDSEDPAIEIGDIGTASWGISAGLQKSDILYAVWKKAYKITYIDSYFPDNSTSQFVVKGESVPIRDSLVDGKKEGWTFLGWTDVNLNSTYVTHETGESCTPTGDMTLWAVWRKLTVNYTDGVSGEVVFPDKGSDGLKNGDTTPEFGDSPERPGYKFMGWRPTVNSVVSADDATDGVITYEATWQWKGLFRLLRVYYGSNGEIDKTATNASDLYEPGDTVSLKDRLTSTYEKDECIYQCYLSEIEAGGKQIDFEQSTEEIILPEFSEWSGWKSGDMKDLKLIYRRVPDSNSASPAPQPEETDTE